VREEVEQLLSNLQQLLIGICIMQVCGARGVGRQTRCGGGPQVHSRALQLLWWLCQPQSMCSSGRRTPATVHACCRPAHAHVRADVHARLHARRQQDLTARARDSLVSFGERLSTRIFASYLRVQGVPALQHDAPDVGVITSDDFGNADVIYEQTLPKV
jgi:hypothetical protein